MRANASGHPSAESAWPEKVHNGIVSDANHIVCTTDTASFQCAPGTVNLAAGRLARCG